MTRPLLLPPAWIRLVQAAGGLSALADELGVSVRTVQRWAHRVTRLRKPAQMALATVARKYRVPAGDL